MAHVCASVGADFFTSSEERPRGARLERCEAALIPVFRSLLALRNWILREDLFDPLESLFRRRLRCHPILHDVDPGRAPDVLVLHLSIGRIQGPELRQSWTEQAL